MPSVALLCLGDGAANLLAETASPYAATLADAGASVVEARWANDDDALFALDDLIERGMPTFIVAAASRGASRERRREPAIPAAQAGPILLVPPADTSSDLAALARTVGARLADAADLVLSVGVVASLRERGLTLVAAESCTGGMLGAGITSVPGSSEVFYGSFVTYSYDAKTKVLGVDGETLVEHGAVSEQVVREMAHGARVVSGADVSVAISGVAGPGGGTPAKPVGTVWIACETTWGSGVARLLHLDGSRSRIRRAAVRECLGLVAECMGGSLG